MNGYVTIRPVITADPPTATLPRFSVTDPWGAEIDQSSSTTQGMQEAINYCAANGYPLDMIGGANNSSGEPYHMDITAIGGLSIPPMRFWTWRMRGFTLNCPAVTGDAGRAGVHFDSLANCDIDWRGSQVVYNGTGRAVHFHPRNPPPTDPTLGMGCSSVYMPQSIAAYGADSICVGFTPYGTTGPIEGNKFVFGELNGGGGEGGAAGTSAIYVDSTPGVEMFSLNDVTVFAAHGCSGGAFHIGTDTHAGCIRGNKWTLLGNLHPGTCFVGTFADGDIFDIQVQGSGTAGEQGFVDMVGGNIVHMITKNVATPNAYPRSNSNYTVLAQ